MCVLYIFKIKPAKSQWTITCRGFDFAWIIQFIELTTNLFFFWGNKNLPWLSRPWLKILTYIRSFYEAIKNPKSLNIKEVL